MFLITGLGNPGSAYRDTRHNVGFMLAERIASRTGATPWQRVGRSLICRTRIQSEPVVLAKPQCYMNRSGQAVAELLHSTGIPLDRILIVFDDVSLPFGRIRIRPSGSSGGQKGMESIIHTLNTEDVPRLRIGIAGEMHPKDLSEFVLSPFDPSETERVNDVLERADQAVQTVIREGLERAMRLFN